MKEGWDAPLSDWIEEIQEYTNDEIVRMSRKALARIRERTPVNTGHLQAGWHLNEMIVGGIVEIDIINQIEYVTFVEYGTDKVAGRFMVEQTLNELIEGTI